MKVTNDNDLSPKKGVAQSLSKGAALSLPKGYKQTDLGVIPEDWEVVSIDEIARTFSGGTPNTAIPSYYGGDINFISSGDLNQGKIKQVDGKITRLGLENSASKIVSTQTLLIALYGATAGVSAITEIDAAINQAVLAVIPFEASSYYINYWWQLNKEILVRTLTQGGQPNLSGSMVRKVLLPLPPLPEQTAIAAALSDMDALIAQTEQLIAKKKAIQQGAMQDLLSGKKRLPGFAQSQAFKNTPIGLLPEDWEVKSVEEVFTFHATASYSKAEMSSDGEIGCLHYGLIHSIQGFNYNLAEGIKYYISKEQAKYEKLSDGDVVMVDASEDLEGVNKSVELSGIGEKDYISGLHTFLLRDKHKVLADNFRGAILNSSVVKKQMLKLAVGMKVYGVSKPQLKTVLLPLPTHTEQTAIAQTLSDMDDAIALLETKLHKLRHQKQGMMQALLTGQIRLV